MATKIQKWGNSFGVRIPKEIVQKLRLKEGSEVFVREGDKHIVIEQVPARKAAVDRSIWKQFLIPSNRKKENVSGNIDTILYGVSSR